VADVVEVLRVSVVYCFTSDLSHPDMLVHLKATWWAHETLCGKRAMPPLRRERSKVTCPICRQRKPTLLGGVA
jgi:hypothetical protein